jgi:hypothetical protein
MQASHVILVSFSLVGCHVSSAPFLHSSHHQFFFFPGDHSSNALSYRLLCGTINPLYSLSLCAASSPALNYSANETKLIIFSFHLFLFISPLNYSASETDFIYSPLHLHRGKEYRNYDGIGLPLSSGVAPFPLSPAQLGVRVPAPDPAIFAVGKTACFEATIVRSREIWNT